MGGSVGLGVVAIILFLTWIPGLNTERESAISLQYERAAAALVNEGFTIEPQTIRDGRLNLIFFTQHQFEAKWGNQPVKVTLKWSADETDLNAWVDSIPIGAFLATERWRDGIPEWSANQGFPLTREETSRFTPSKSSLCAGADRCLEMAVVRDKAPVSVIYYEAIDAAALLIDGVPLKNNQ
ncbi:hypothetical protein [Lysinibacter cavernae]|uniref:hypothetical protein n=1 Tax=Lysinibacter cavernae TaxID=1640652 RepID=UPI0036D9095A